MIAIGEYRRLAKELLRYAVGTSVPLDPPDESRPALGDPVYNAVVEGRQEQAHRLAEAWDRADPATRGPHRPFFSSCAEPAHWLFFRLGVRLDFINRSEFQGWKSSVDVSRLLPLASVPRIGDEFDTGDVFIVNVATPATTHVRIVYEVPSDAYVITADYGQPGAALRNVELIGRADSRFALGSRSADFLLKLENVLHVAESKGALVSPESALEWADRLGLPEP